MLKGPMNRSIHFRAAILVASVFALIAVPAGTASAKTKAINGPLVVANYAGLGSKNVRTDVLAIPEKGKPEKLLSKAGLNGAIAISPDGRRFVYQAPASTGSLYLSWVKRPGKKLRLSAASENALPGDAVFSPDGKSIYYTSTTVTTGDPGNPFPGEPEFRTSLKQYFLASRKSRTIDFDPGTDVQLIDDISQNGRIIAFSSRFQLESRITFLNLKTGRQWRFNSKRAASLASFSPDGKRIAFNSTSIPKIDVFIAKLDGTGLRRINPAGTLGVYPLFSPDGRKVAYAKSNGTSIKSLEVMNLKSGKTATIKAPSAYAIPYQWLPSTWNER